MNVGRWWQSYNLVAVHVARLFRVGGQGLDLKSVGESSRLHAVEELFVPLISRM